MAEEYCPSHSSPHVAWAVRSGNAPTGPIMTATRAKPCKGLHSFNLAGGYAPTRSPGRGRSKHRPGTDTVHHLPVASRMGEAVVRQNCPKALSIDGGPNAFALAIDP